MRAYSLSAIAVLFCVVGLSETRADELPSDDLPPALSATVRVAGDDYPVPGVNPEVAVGATLDYAFPKDWSLGAQFSYERPFSQFDDYVYNGANDLTLYIQNKSLWVVKSWGLNFAAQLGFIYPTSEPSQIATLRYGFSETVTIREEFSKSFSVTYQIGLREFQYEYDTATDSTATYFNTRLDLVNRLTMTYNITDDFHFSVGGAVRTFNNYSDGSVDIYEISAALSYDIVKSVSMDFGARNATIDSSTFQIYNSPVYGNYVFDKNGDTIYLALNIKIGG